jgi:effector-binding domain-containing protein
MVRRRFVIQAIAAAALIIPKPARLLAQSTVHTEPIDPFGQAITLTEKNIVYASGTGDWDKAYQTLMEAFKTVQVFLDSKGIKPSGPAMTIYTAIDDMTFNFQAAMPVAEPPKGPSPDKIGIGMSPGGKALKFVHRGSFDEMMATYDAISHYAEENQISAKEILVEEYVSDFLTTPADKLVINIFVPVN